VLRFTLLPTPKPTPSFSATHAVGFVAPQRLASVLLATPFTPKQLPNEVSPSRPELFSFRATGLVEAAFVPLVGPAASLSLNYFVFDNAGDASSFYTVRRPLPDGYSLTGHFTPAGIGDQNKCDTGRETGRWDSSCEALSDTVVTFVVVTSLTDTASHNDSLAGTLTKDAIVHLSGVADATARTAVTPPPASLTPLALRDQIYSSPFGNALLPTGISFVSLQKYPLGSSAPTGLIDSSYLRALLAGKTYRDNLYFYVFDSTRDAQAFFKTQLRPTGYAGTGSIDSSGFSQQTSCGTYFEAASSTSVAEHISACAVLWGDVVIYSEAGPSVVIEQDANALAVTLARMALIDIDRLDSN